MFQSRCIHVFVVHGFPFVEWLGLGFAYAEFHHVAVIVRAGKDDRVTGASPITLADDDVAVRVALCGVHGKDPFEVVRMGIRRRRR